MDLVGSHTETQTPQWSRNEASATGKSFDWDFFVRTGLLGEAVDALLNGPGVLLDGIAGSGRKTMAAAVLRQLQGKILLIDLGFPERHRTTFAFKKLLDDLEYQDEEVRFQAVGIAHSMLQQQSAGLPVVVYVPESLALGHRKASFLSALALADTVSLLCLNTMLPTAEPQEKDDLLGSVRLHRIRLNSLSLAETHRRLILALGGEVSRAAAYQIWHTAAGQLHMISALAQDWFDLGYLINSEHGWIVNGDQRPVGPRSRAIWSHVVSGTHGAEREVLELLALTEEIPLSVLMGVCEAGPVDSVYAKGLVEIGGHFPRSIRLSKILNGSVVTDLTPPGKARELLEKFQNVHANSPHTKPVIQFRWEQAAGFTARHELVISAAAQALAEHRVELCLQILDGHRTSDAESDLLRLGALVFGNYVEYATELLALLRAEFGSTMPAPAVGKSQRDLTFMVRLNTLAILLNAKNYGVESLQPYGDFAAIRHGIEAWKTIGNDTPGHLNLLSGRLDLEESEILYHVGKPLWDEELPYSHPYLESEEQQRWQCLHNLHSIRRGHVRLALKRGSELFQMLRQDFMSTGLSQGLKQYFVDLYLISGEWDKALELIDAAWIGGQDSQRITERSGLYSSLVHVFMGHDQDALSQLGIEIEQLRALDTEGQLPFAIAAAALAASTINEHLANSYLSELERVPESWSWDTNQGVLVLKAVAEFNLGRQEEALDMLSESVEVNAARGALNLELTSRMIRLRLGDRQGIDQMLACAQKIDGILADEVLSLVANADKDEYDGQSQTLTMMRTSGRANPVRATNGLKGQLKEPVSSGQGRVLKTVPQELDGTMQQGTESSAAMQLMTLTSRQRTIVAEVVAGASSRTISQRLNIGVRTVEGHIYQIYQRLHVTSRQQLVELYQDAQESKDEP